MATGTQMVLGVKKIIKIIVPSGLHLDKELAKVGLKKMLICKEVN